MPPAPPTIAHLKSHGLEGLFVVCANAARQHATHFTFDALGLTDDVRSLSASDSCAAIVALEQ